MSFNRMMASIFAGSDVKIIHGEVMGNIDPYIEWIKWLSYVPEFEKVRMQELMAKNIESMTLEELDEIKSYKKQRRMLELFKIYGTSKISKDEYREVYDFMVNQSIDEFMLRKLSSNELRYAKEQIQYLRQIPREELRKKINSERKEDNYKNLAMVDAFILHMIARIDHIRSMEKLEKEIKMRLKENDVMMEKSLNYASNPWNSRG